MTGILVAKPLTPSGDTMPNEDIEFMKIAIEEAKKSRGEDSREHPRVGAVVVKDVPARALVVGNPARVLREVPDEELLELDSQ